MSKPTEYIITTLAEIEQIPPDRLEHFLEDLLIWLDLRQYGRKIGLESDDDSMYWIDDTKWHNADITIEATEESK